MYDNGTHDDSALTSAVDPASDRLTREAVIAINQAHLDGESWASIAQRHGTSRQNVQRIVQGRRWRSLHPLKQPALYDVPAETEAAPGMPLDDVEAAFVHAMNAAQRAFAEALVSRRRVV